MKLTVDYIDLARPAHHDGQQVTRITGRLLTIQGGGKPATYDSFEIELEPGFVLIPQKDGRRLRLPSQDCQVMESREQPVRLAAPLPPADARTTVPSSDPVVEKARGNKKTR